MTEEQLAEWEREAKESLSRKEDLEHEVATTSIDELAKDNRAFKIAIKLLGTDPKNNERILALIAAIRQRDEWIRQKDEALKHYANPKNYEEFISGGNIFDEQDGDFCFAFNADKDNGQPTLTALKALAIGKDKP